MAFKRASASHFEPPAWPQPVVWLNIEPLSRTVMDGPDRFRAYRIVKSFAKLRVAKLDAGRFPRAMQSQKGPNSASALRFEKRSLGNDRRGSLRLEDDAVVRVARVFQMREQTKLAEHLRCRRPAPCYCIIVKLLVPSYCLRMEPMSL